MSVTIDGAAGSITATGDLSAAGGYRQTIDGWSDTDTAANQAAVSMTRTAGRWVAPRAGSVTGIVVTSSEARTAGSATVEVWINTGLAGAAGAATGLTAVLDGSNTSRHATTQAKDLDTFVAGDEIFCKITTDAGWLPVTADLAVAIEVET